MYFRILAALFLFLLASCEKTQPPVPKGSASEAPEISIANPTSSDHYDHGESITISATITDNKEIHSAKVVITNLSTNAIVYSPAEIPYIHLGSYSFNDSYTVTESVPATYRITITSSDLDNNSSQKTVDVTVN